MPQMQWCQVYNQFIQHMPLFYLILELRIHLSTFIQKNSFPIITFEYDLCFDTLLGVDIVLGRACKSCPIIVRASSPTCYEHD